MSKNQTKGTKKGISPVVLLLLLIAILAITILVFSLNPPKKPNIPSQTPDTTAPEAIPPAETFIPVTPPPVINDENVTLFVQSKKVHLNSGGEVSYGYPSLTIKDAPDVSARINDQLTDLVEDKILPIIEQMKTEDTPDAYRHYNFTLKQGSGFYCIVVTVDISEGITSAKEIYGWNFFSDSGEYVSLATHCFDRNTLAATIDGCIENVASYDQIIHQWLVDTVTGEHESNEFSFYFDNDSMIAILNKRLRLNSFDRDPILITVPYEKIASVFPNISE